MPLTTITALESLFDHLRATQQTTGTLVVVGAAGGVGSILVQLARTLTGLRIIGTASRPDSVDWAQTMGAHDAIAHHDLATLAPGGVDYLFTAHSQGHFEVYRDIIRPFGHIVAIDDVRQDLYPLKSKSITWHWELMFTRPMHHVADLDRQGRRRKQLRARRRPVQPADLRHDAEAERVRQRDRDMGQGLRRQRWLVLAQLRPTDPRAASGDGQRCGQGNEKLWLFLGFEFRG
jgi:NADPH:quinone reductase-like Zn-dependent oxidoreductase